MLLTQQKSESKMRRKKNRCADIQLVCIWFPRYWRWNGKNGRKISEEKKMKETSTEYKIHVSRAISRIFFEKLWTNIEYEICETVEWWSTVNHTHRTHFTKWHLTATRMTRHRERETENDKTMPLWRKWQKKIILTWLWKLEYNVKYASNAEKSWKKYTEWGVTEKRNIFIVLSWCQLWATFLFKEIKCFVSSLLFHFFPFAFSSQSSIAASVDLVVVAFIFLINRKFNSLEISAMDERFALIRISHGVFHNNNNDNYNNSSFQNDDRINLKSAIQ